MILGACDLQIGFVLHVELLCCLPINDVEIWQAVAVRTPSFLLFTRIEKSSLWFFEYPVSHTQVSVLKKGQHHILCIAYENEIGCVWWGDLLEIFKLIVMNFSQELLFAHDLGFSVFHLFGCQVFDVLKDL